MALVENKCKCLLSANHTAKLIHHHVLDIKNITRVFLIWCIRMHESVTAHLSHLGLYSKKKSFIFNHFMIKYIHNLIKLINKVHQQLNKVNKQQEVFIK